MTNGQEQRLIALEGMVSNLTVRLEVSLEANLQAHNRHREDIRELKGLLQEANGTIKTLQGQVNRWRGGLTILISLGALLGWMLVNLPGLPNLMARLIGG